MLPFSNGRVLPGPELRGIRSLASRIDPMAFAAIGALAGSNHRATFGGKEKPMVFYRVARAAIVYVSLVLVIPVAFSQN